MLKYTYECECQSNVNNEWPKFAGFFYFVFIVLIKIICFRFSLSKLILLLWTQLFDWILKLKTSNCKSIQFQRPFYNKMNLKWRTICMLYAYSVFLVWSVFARSHVVFHTTLMRWTNKEKKYGKHASDTNLKMPYHDLSSFKWNRK